MVYIPEKDVYRLIMRSNLPNAEQFQDWVCDEVLPSIRKHGGYLTPGQDRRGIEQSGYHYTFGKYNLRMSLKTDHFFKRVSRKIRGL